MALTHSHTHSKGNLNTQISVQDKQWGHKGPDPSTPKANSKAQIIHGPTCFENQLFTKKKQVNIFHPLLFLDVKQE